MARPSKTGLAYYNIDSDLFQNRKIKRLIKTFSGKGFMIYSFVLNEIYRDNGCFIVWDLNTAFDVSDTLNVTENLVKEVIEYCGVVGLFNTELLSREGILTSKNIQERWEKISKEAKRSINKVSQLNPKYSLTHEETELIPEETQEIMEETTPKAEVIPQSKGKESIEYKYRVFSEIKNFPDYLNSFEGNKSYMFLCYKFWELWKIESPKDKTLIDADIKLWYNEMRKMIELDKTDIERVLAIYAYFSKSNESGFDNFWFTTIQSIAGLRGKNKNKEFKIDKIAKLVNAKTAEDTEFYQYIQSIIKKFNNNESLKSPKKAV